MEHNVELIVREMIGTLAHLQAQINIYVDFNGVSTTLVADTNLCWEVLQIGRLLNKIAAVDSEYTEVVKEAKIKAEKEFDE